MYNKPKSRYHTEIGMGDPSCKIGSNTIQIHVESKSLRITTHARQAPAKSKMEKW